MYVYLVEVTADIPYPWTKSYPQEATTPGTAISRSLSQYRQDVRAQRGKAKRINDFTIKVSRQRAVVADREGEGGA